MSILPPSRALVTGATGLLGSHVVRALHARGHAVRAFVRSPDKAARVFADDPSLPEVARGDISDVSSVRAALEGCDAVVHCAAVISVDSANDPTALIDTNVGGVRNVIGSALDAGVTRIVHVSSIAPLFRADGQPVTETSEPQPSDHAYGQSKRLAELHVRELQARGEPVKIIYPGAILGPDDPGLTESMRSIKIFAGRFLPLTTSGMQYVDVRDVAGAIARMLEDDPDATRALAPGHFVTWKELADLLEKTMGKRPPAIWVPASLLRFAGWLTDLLRRVIPIELPLSMESATYITRWTPIETSESLARLGVTFRPLEQTMSDTIRWMKAHDHL